MAEYKSDTYVAQEAATAEAYKYIHTSQLQTGESATLQVKITVPVGGLVADDTVLGAELTKGFTVVPSLTTVTVPQAAGAGTLKIGVVGDDDAIAPTGVGVNTAGSATVSSIVPFYTPTKTETILFTATGALTAGREIYVTFHLVKS